MNKFFLILTSLFFIFSCQPVEILDDIVFDYNQFSKITINAKKKTIIDSYDTKFEDPYIAHSLEKSPKFYLNRWIDQNIKLVGNQNNFIINILEASLKRIVIDNIDTKKYKEKKIYLYELNFLIEFLIYDDSNMLLGTTIVNSNATTTSGKFISLMESEKIIDILILEALNKISLESRELILIHMKNYIL